MNFDYRILVLINCWGLLFNLILIDAWTKPCFNLLMPLNIGMAMLGTPVVVVLLSLHLVPKINPDRIIVVYTYEGQDLVFNTVQFIVDISFALSAYFASIAGRHCLHFFGINKKVSLMKVRAPVYAKFEGLDEETEDLVIPTGSSLGV